MMKAKDSGHLFVTIITAPVEVTGPHTSIHSTSSFSFHSPPQPPSTGPPIQPLARSSTLMLAGSAEMERWTDLTQPPSPLPCLIAAANIQIGIAAPGQSASDATLTNCQAFADSSGPSAHDWTYWGRAGVEVPGDGVFRPVPVSAPVGFQFSLDELEVYSGSAGIWDMEHCMEADRASRQAGQAAGGDAASNGGGMMPEGQGGGDLSGGSHAPRDERPSNAPAHYTHEECDLMKKLKVHAQLDRIEPPMREQEHQRVDLPRSYIRRMED
mmetsp:Transcript_9358/g.26963  ORF Transcript_9358/g.26963 Transcript_9358/m.26963 type:complete len:269 (+) Transcript_9358:842-1648(+)